VRVSPNPDFPDPAQRLERIGTPLSPARIEELGYLPQVPEPVPAADGATVLTYRIWGGHGFVGTRNFTVGSLSISRGAPSGGEIPVEAVQRVAYAGGIEHTIRAAMTCRNAPLPALVSWRVSSRITRTDGSPEGRLDLDAEYRVVAGSSDSGRPVGTEGGVAVERRAGTTITTIALLGTPVGDWPLFASVGLLGADEDGWRFDFVDGMTLLKPGHALRHAAGVAQTICGGRLELRCLHQIGPGVLPFEYWIDTEGRLVAAISGNRAWLLDDAADAVVDANLASLRRGDAYVE
jgi:hypothetical protein